MLVRPLRNLKQQKTKKQQTNTIEKYKHDLPCAPQLTEHSTAITVINMSFILRISLQDQASYSVRFASPVFIFSK